MAKIGIECEGRLRGIKTLFIDASELTVDLGLKSLIEEGKVTHVYVSDHQNTLDYNELGKALGACYVTLEVTKVKDEPRPLNVGLMLALPEEHWNSVQLLGPDDQVKFSWNQHVLASSMRNFVATYPIEFVGDVEL